MATFLKLFLKIILIPIFNENEWWPNFRYGKILILTSFQSI